MGRIYISGKITNNPNWVLEFSNAEKFLKERGFTEIINPLNLARVVDKQKKNPTWEDYMKLCVEKLATCDSIFLLDNYYKSKGAKEELKIAKMLGMEVFMGV